MKLKDLTSSWAILTIDLILNLKSNARMNENPPTNLRAYLIAFFQIADTPAKLSFQNIPSSCKIRIFLNPPNFLKVSADCLVPPLIKELDPTISKGSVLTCTVVSIEIHTEQIRLIHTTIVNMKLKDLTSSWAILTIDLILNLKSNLNYNKELI